MVVFGLSLARFVCVVGLLVLVSTLSTHGVMSGLSTTRAWVGFFAALVAPIGAIGDARVHGFRIVGLTRPLCGRAARPVDLWRTTGVLDRICAHHHPPGSNPSFDPLYTVNTTALPLTLPSIRWNDSVHPSFPPSEHQPWLLSCWCVWGTIFQLPGSLRVVGTRPPSGCRWVQPIQVP